MKTDMQMVMIRSNSTLHVFKDAEHAIESDVPDLFFNSIINFI